MPHASIPVSLLDFYVILMHLDSLTLAMSPCYGSTCTDWRVEKPKSTDYTARPSQFWVPNRQSNQMGVVRIPETDPVPILFNEL